jgi:hypothetical protein
MQNEFGVALEERDTEHAIALWKKKAEQFGKPPPISEFRLNKIGHDCFRFLILIDLLVNEDSVFLAYGAIFAKRLSLPERPSIFVPMLKSIPDRYRFLFAEGCNRAIAQAAPLRFGGQIANAGGSELYRACFMPLKMGIETMQAVYGSFNFRFLSTVNIGERDRRATEGRRRRPLQSPVGEININYGSGT